MADSKFSAVDATLGYAYQIRSALLHALRHARDGDEFQVGIETLDDVAFTSTDGEPLELLQTKHHLSARSTLNNAGIDIWKTIRIWVEGHRCGVIPASAKLFLITTATAPDNSVAANLRSESRNVAAAVSALNATAASSQNEENKAAYEVYTALSQAERLALMSQAYVIDAAPSITDLDSELKREVRWSADKDHVDAFLQRLEGWWFQRILRQLTKAAPLVESGEIESQMTDLREQFQREALPIDDDLLELELNETLIASCKDKLFVRQIELVTANAKRVGFAIRDYFRAYEQRSRWIRQDLVIEMELHKYERRLVDEWEMAFERTRDEIGDSATEAIMAKAGASLLSWAETTLLPIRKGVLEPFVSRGSFHMLADEARVGWHLEFRKRLAAALDQRGATT